MKTFISFAFLFFIALPILAQYGGYTILGGTNLLGNNSTHSIFTDTTYNDGSITSATSSSVYFMGSVPNAQHLILAKNGGAVATQIGNAILNNGIGGLFINNPATGLEISNNFNFNGQNAQVTTLRNAGAIVNNNLHIDATAGISGSNAVNNVNGYLKKDGDGISFTFPLAHGAVAAGMFVSGFVGGNSITAAYYYASGNTAAAFEGGPFTLTSVTPANLIVSNTEYYNVITTGISTSLFVKLSLIFNGNYSNATPSTIFIVGWNITTKQWEQIATDAPVGLTPGNIIVSTNQVNFVNYAAFTIATIQTKLPKIIAVATPTTCGLQDGTITATGSGGTAPYQYSIDSIHFQSANIFTNLAAGNYTVYLKDANGLLADTTITVSPSVAAKIFAGNDTTIIINQPLQLNAIDVSSIGFTQYIWSPAYGLSNTNIKNPIATFDKDITYTVIGIAPIGCSDTGKINIKVFTAANIFVPTAFTPNGDGKNDVLRAITVGIKIFKYFVVYNRYGQQIFYTSNPANGWDGIFKGSLQNVGSYVWIVEGIDYKGNIIFKKGSTILIR